MDFTKQKKCFRKENPKLVFFINKYTRVGGRKSSISTRIGDRGNGRRVGTIPRTEHSRNFDVNGKTIRKKCDICTADIFKVPKPV